MISYELYRISVDWKSTRFWLGGAIFGLLLTGLLGANLVIPANQLQGVEERLGSGIRIEAEVESPVESPDAAYPEALTPVASGAAEVNSEPADRIWQAPPSVAVVSGDQFYLPEGARARLGRGTLRDAVLSENKEFFYVAGSIGVYAHRVEDFSEIWKVITAEPVGGLNVSPDGSVLAYFVKGQVNFLEAETGKLLSTIETGEGELRAVAFNPASDHLAAQSDYTVGVWETASGELVNQLIQESGISAIAWSGDGSQLAIGDSQVLLWDPWGAESAGTATDIEGTISDLVWSQEGGLVVAGLVSGGVKIWNLENGETIVTESGHDLWVSCLDVSPAQNLVASGGKDGRVMFWDGRTGEKIKSIPAHQSRVASLAFLLDGRRLLSAGLDGQIFLWDIESGERIQAFDGYMNAVNEVAWSPDGKWIAGGGMDGNIYIWQADSGGLYRKLEGHRQAIERLVWSNNSALLASLTSESAVLVWNVDKGEIRRKIEQKIKVPERAVLMPDGTPLESEIEAKAYDASFSPDDRFIALGGKDARVYIWDLESGEKANLLAGHTWEVIGVDYIEGGDRLVSMSMDGTLLYWNPSSAELEDQKYYPGMTSMVLAPEEELIAMGEWDGHVVMWDTANEIPYRSFNGSNDAVFLSEFSPDGRYLISGADGELKSALVWETATGEILQEFTGHTFDVRGVSISPDSAVLATGAWDGTILLWNLD